MINTLYNLIILLDPTERIKAILIISLSLIIATLDMIGVASILPFMLIITNDSLTNSNIIFSKFTNYLFLENKETSLIYIGIFLIGIFFLSMIAKIFNIYFQTNFTLKNEYNIGNNLLKSHLHSSYDTHLKNNSTDTGTLVLSEVTTVVGSGLMPLFSFFSNIILLSAILTVLLIIDFNSTTKIGLLLVILYFLIFFTVGNKLKISGDKRQKSNKQRFAIINEIYNLIKEIKFRGKELEYLEYYKTHSKEYYKNNIISLVLSQSPRYFIEGIIFGTIIILTVVLVSNGKSSSETIALLALYAVAGYKILPAAQQIYASISQMKYIESASANLVKIFNDQKSKNLNEQSSELEIISFKDSIILKNINYFYLNNSKKNVLDNINIEIKANQTIGIVGKSGSGKSTLVDILMGLLIPTSGEILIDGKVLNSKNILSWRKLIGYIPQKVRLKNDNISSNIAFELNYKKINRSKVDNASKMSSIDDLVFFEKNNHSTLTVGEDGKKLSGGQIQRIGIARALYNEPSILIMDEGTSALDNNNKLKIMNSIYNFKNKKTIILISHELSLLDKCDQIIIMEKGMIIDHGTYDYLYNKSKNLKSLYE